jgi:hypothetical protein
VVCVFEEFDVLLQIFQVKFFLRFEKESLVGLVGFEAQSFLFEGHDSIF